jgi:hypothetical protein
MYKLKVWVVGLIPGSSSGTTIERMERVELQTFIMTEFNPAIIFGVLQKKMPASSAGMMRIGSEFIYPHPEVHGVAMPRRVG